MSDGTPPGHRPHPLVARMWDRMSRDLDRKGLADHRRRLVAGLSGRVIEVGAGNGRNFRHYPPSVTQVVAVEPEPHLREVAAKAAADAPVPVEIRAGTAGALPAGAAEFDAAVVSLVLCLVPDVGAALGELRRVIRPGGELRFLEHVRSERPLLSRAQRAFDVVWPRVNGWGCHAGRDTASSLRTAGFEIEELDRFSFRTSPLDVLLSPHIIGLARQPAQREEDRSA